MNTRTTQLKAFDRLLSIMDELREKCPWDQKQTMESLRPLTIEETYELGDAILEADSNDIKGELGDLLLHIVFYAKIGSETKDFDISDVIHGICDKLVKNEQQDAVEDEFGDVLFSMINYARFLNINPENALERTNKKFIKRFQYLENKAKGLQKKLSDMTLAEMDIYWEEAKNA